MKKGYLAHYCCCDSSIYKHATIFTDSNRLATIEPFAGETANTTFYDGLLMVANCDFRPHLDTFRAQLQEALSNDTQLSVADAILQNSIYKLHCATADKECLIYAITPIQWHSMRPNTIENLKIELISTL